jgi:hypothetical protein
MIFENNILMQAKKQTKKVAESEDPNFVADTFVDEEEFSCGSEALSYTKQRVFSSYDPIN